LDVWFVSGISHVLLSDQADIYIEGRDQHRGWFSSSLITSLFLNSRPPFRTLITHGFLLNSQGEKLSKSKLEYVQSLLPQNLQTQGMYYSSADVLRLWAASFAVGPDLAMTDDVLKPIRRDYMKLRKTFRTLLGHLQDFDAEKDPIPVTSLFPVDQFALMDLFSTYSKIIKCYNSYDFPTALKIFISYFKEDLRCGYLESGKNRLYFEKNDSIARRSCQTCLFWILDTMTRLVAPILTFLSEEVFDEYKGPHSQSSIHLEPLKVPPNVWQEISKEKSFAAMKFKQTSTLEKIRSQAGKEIAKSYLGHIGNALPAHVVVSMNPETYQIFQSLQPLEDFLEEYLSVSTVTVTVNLEGMKEPFLVSAIKPKGEECARCWRFRQLVDNGLCQRCDVAVKTWELDNLL